MPGFDRSGPMGAGPMTGGRRGLCNSATAQDARAFVGGYGYGRGFRGGFGRGRGWRRGVGRGYGWVPAATGPTGAVDSGTELAALRDEADYLKESLDAVHRRIDELEQKPVDES
ncbi:MAG: DUF5320 domain-containing protein [Desulfobacterales bacterium]